MPYVSSFEQLAYEKAFLGTLGKMLKTKFGDEGLKLIPELRELDYLKLEEVIVAAGIAQTLDEVRRAYATGS